MNPLEIAHFAFHNATIGDGALVAGIRRHIDAAFPGHRYVARDVMDFERLFRGGQHNARQTNDGLKMQIDGALDFRQGQLV